MAYVDIAQPISYHSTRAINPLDKPPAKNEIRKPEYDDTGWKYYSYLIQRLQRASEARDRKHAEFSNKTYLQYYEQNEKIAHTYLEPVANEAEEKLATGTIESKLNTLLSHIDNLNLTPEVNAFDRNNKTLRELGQSFTDIMAVVAEHDGGDDGGDREKKMHRQRELIKQGTVFVQDNWITRYKIKKTLKDKYKGQFKNYIGHTENLVKSYEGCSRDVLYGPNVFLGDVTTFSMNDQPYIFTVESMPYDRAKQIYGHFENWEYVTPGKPSTTIETTTASGGGTIYDAKWRLTNVKDDHVEIIKYQDEGRDEFAIMINNVLLTPPGFPLSAVTPDGRYNITKQTLYVINPQFAYGKSFVSSGAVYEISKALDRFIRLFELKTRKSITPPYVNISNRVIPAEALNPGNISMGIAPNALQPIGTESQGVTSSEYQIFKEMQEQLEKSTISSIFQGQQASRGATATEVIEVQRQARLTLGLIISACTLLEIKIGYLRLNNILANWLSPVGRYADGSNRYRTATRQVAIDGAGFGERRVIPIDGELPKPEAVRMLSLQDEQKYKYPVRRSYLSPQQVREAEITWYITVEPREQESSSYHKLLFREMIGDAITLAQLGAQPNIGGITDEFAKVYNVDKASIFSQTGPSPMVDPNRVAGDRAAGNNINQQGVAQPSAGGGQPQPKPPTEA